MRSSNLTLLAFMVWGATARADEWVQFCATHPESFVDSGFGEDYWTNPNPTSKAARGAKLRVYRNGSEVTGSPFYAGDGIGAGDPGLGCTPEIDVAQANANYEIRIYSQGQVQGNSIDVYDYDTGYIYYRPVYVTVSSGSGSYGADVSSGDSPIFRAYQATAFALYRHAGGMTGKLYKLRVGAPVNANNTGAGEILLTDAGRKFVVVHEVGHRLSNLKTDGEFSANIDYDMNDSPCETEPGNGNHQMTSQEYQGAALAEGFAHFYAADVFNSHGATNCKFKYYKTITSAKPGVGEITNPTIDCEVGDTHWPTAYQESRPCEDPFDGLGVELDWLRMWWDFHTDSGTKPTFTQIADLCAAADDWGPETAFDVFDAAVSTFMSGAFEGRWDGDVSLNGVDH